MLPFARFAGADSVLGPEMKSTGEVMGIASDFPTAFGKAQAAAGVSLPAEGTVFITVTDTDKPAATQIAARFHDLGFSSSPPAAPPRRSRRWACRSTAINKIGEGSPHVVDCIRNEQVDMVINTPTGRAPAPTAMRSAAPRSPRDPLHHHDDRGFGGIAGDLAPRASGAAGPAPCRSSTAAAQRPSARALR